MSITIELHKFCLCAVLMLVNTQLKTVFMLSHMLSAREYRSRMAGLVSVTIVPPHPPKLYSTSGRGLERGLKLLFDVTHRYSPQLIDVFFGREAVKLTTVEGQLLPYTKGSITSPGTQLHYEEAKKRFKPLVELGEEYGSCVVPAIPAADLVMR